MTIDADKIAGGTEFSVTGASGYASVGYSAKYGGLVLERKNAFILIVK